MGIFSKLSSVFRSSKKKHKNRVSSAPCVALMGAPNEVDMFPPRPHTDSSLKESIGAANGIFTPRPDELESVCPSSSACPAPSPSASALAPSSSVSVSNVQSSPESSAVVPKPPSSSQSKLPDRPRHTIRRTVKKPSNGLTVSKGSSSVVAICEGVTSAVNQGKQYQSPMPRAASSVTSELSFESGAESAVCSAEDVTMLVGLVFGSTIQTHLASDKWDLRTEALKQIDKSLCSGEVDLSAVDTTSLLCVCREIVISSIKSRVAPVLFGGLQVLRTLLSQFIVTIEAKQVQSCFKPLLKALRRKLGDSNMRVHEAVCKMFGYLCQHPAFGLEYMLPFILKPVTKARATFALWGRLDLMLRMVSEFGLQVGKPETCQSLRIEPVMTFVTPCLNVPDDKVRALAMQLTVEIFKVLGHDVRSYLTQVKPALVHVLDRKFAEARRLQMCETGYEEGSRPDEEDNKENQCILDLSITGKHLPPLQVDASCRNGSTHSLEPQSGFYTLRPVNSLRQSTDSFVNLGSPQVLKTMWQKGFSPESKIGSIRSIKMSSSIRGDLGGDSLSDLDSGDLDMGSILRMEFEREDETLMDDILGETGLAFKSTKVLLC
eukprot:GILK01010007.1.p1 GENE.GILK01010007.1~~GILK01010007.1.p1  ORF type:complete len:632 (+),score=89.52 GILK01010007.1:86-1897(+)